MLEIIQGSITSKEDVLNMSLEDFLAIVIDIPENKKSRRILVGNHSSLRSFLLYKKRNKKKRNVVL